MGGLAIGIGSIASGVMGYMGASEASDKQAEAAANALAAQQAMFAQAQKNYAPWIDVGGKANYQLGNLYGIGNGPQTQDYSQFYNSPDYAFAQQQGNLALERANNAKGLNLSGGALKDAMSYNQGLASQQFGNYFNRLYQLSSLGSNAAANAGSNAAGFSSQIGNSMQAIGQAQASGAVGGANAISGAVNGGINNSLLYNAINRSSYAGGGFGGGASTGGLSMNSLTGFW